VKVIDHEVDELLRKMAGLWADIVHMGSKWAWDDGREQDPRKAISINAVRPK
jgi:hypothetical protein